MGLREAYLEYKKDYIYGTHQGEAVDLWDLLAPSRQGDWFEKVLLGINKAIWDNEDYDPHSMLYDWLFAKRNGLIKYVRFDRVNDSVVYTITRRGRLFRDYCDKAIMKEECL